MKTFPTLYAVSKTGKVIMFDIRVVLDAGAGIIQQWTGQVGGKLTKRERTIRKGKNIGRSNETTAQSQAISEAQSDWNKKLKEGYKPVREFMPDKTVKVIRKPYELFDTEGRHRIGDNHIMTTPEKAAEAFIKEGIKFNTDHNDRHKPMLADKYKKHRERVKFPVLAQPKYNGVRCAIVIEDGKPVLLSREGEIYNVSHVTDAVPQAISRVMAESNISLDGELYIHDMALQDIASRVKTPSLLSLDLRYVAYDTASDRKQYKRIQDRRSIVAMCNDTGIVETEEKICENEHELMQYFRDCRDAGYEGIIVRNFDSRYLFGFRDKALLKIKETISAEFKIAGATLSTEGARPEDFVWICETPEGREFEVKPHGTIEQRIQQYRERDQHIGKVLQLSFYEYTKDKIPFHITEVAIRDYE